MKVLLSFAIVVNCVWLISGNPWSNDPLEQIITNWAGIITRPASVESFKELENAKDVSNLRMTTMQTGTLGGRKPIFDIHYDALPSHCNPSNSSNASIPTNCAEATACTKRSGYYKIKLNAFSNNAFLVECDAQTDGGDWTVIQTRLDGSENFYRTWSQYRDGFGEIEGEYFIGLDKLHALTNLDGRQELRVELERSDMTTAYAQYSSFAIGSATDGYVLKRVGGYSGTAGDSLQPHVGSRFSTMDRNNGNTNSATTYSSGWWYNANRISDLNGLYGKTDGKGILWNTFHISGIYLKSVKMMIRRYRV